MSKLLTAAVAVTIFTDTFASVRGFRSELHRHSCRSLGKDIQLPREAWLSRATPTRRPVRLKFASLEKEFDCRISGTKETFLRSKWVR